jgi:hypothetical protein
MDNTDIQRIVSSIPNGYYLLTRGWFVRNASLQANVLLIIEAGHGSDINAVHGDFAEHIDELLSRL